MNGPTEQDVNKAILLAADAAECEREGGDLAAQAEAYGDIADAIASARDLERARCKSIVENIRLGKAEWCGPCEVILRLIIKEIA